MGAVQVGFNDVASVGSVSSLTVPLTDLGGTPITATAGNLLLASCRTYKTRLSNTPGGWTLLASLSTGPSTALQLFGKVSDGTETSVTFTPSVTWSFSGTIGEWSGATLGTVTSGYQTIPVGTLSWSVGPTDSPVSASAVPAFFLNQHLKQLGLAPSSPWTGTYNGGAAYASGGSFSQPAPNAAVSLSLTSSSSASANDSCWINAWLEPSSGTSAIAGSANATFTDTGAVAGSTSAAGSANLTLASSGAVSGSAAVAGSGNLSLSANG
jgi:hypothetical protein